MTLKAHSASLPRSDPVILWQSLCAFCGRSRQGTILRKLFLLGLGWYVAVARETASLLDHMVTHTMPTLSATWYASLSPV